MKRFSCGFSFQRKSATYRAVGFLLLVLAFGVAPVMAGADTIDVRVDVTTNSSTVAQWNRLGLNATVSNLIDYTSSSATTIDVSMTIYTGATDTRANGCWTKGNVGWVNSTAAGSTIGGSSEEHPWQITFSDLSADYTYTIEVVASCICDTGLNIADYTVNGVFADTNRLGIAGVNGDDYDLHADGYVSGNWLIWTDLQPDSNGEITIESTFRKGSDGEYWNAAFINAIRITATAKSIPLPSSIMLLLLDK